LYKFIPNGLIGSKLAQIYAKNNPNLSQSRANYIWMSPFGTNIYKNYLLGDGLPKGIYIPYYGLKKNKKNIKFKFLSSR
jgi:hypothetical protein